MRLILVFMILILCACSSRNLEKGWCVSSDDQASCALAYYDCLLDAEVRHDDDTYHLVIPASRHGEDRLVDSGLALTISGSQDRSIGSRASWSVSDDDSMLSVHLAARYDRGEYAVDMQGESFFVHPAENCQ